MSEGRSVWRLLFNNIRNAFKILPPKGKLVGEDHLGNKYYQAPKDPYSNRKSAPRWFVPQTAEDWQQDLPAEWEAWLRGRRRDAPTVEEVMNNLSIAKMKKIKGMEIEAKAQEKRTASDSQIGLNPKGFPVLKDFEREAGTFSDNKSKYEYDKVE